MIITRAPYRISLFGGGTDYPEWYLENGGTVLATTIDKYCYISVRPLPPFFEHKHRIAYSVIETVKSIPEIKHPAVRAIMQEEGYGEGLEIHYDGDLPARSGIGSSSVFVVGLTHAMRTLKGEFIGKKALAERAIWIEQKVIGETVGSQDQISAAYGGFNRIDFNTDGSFGVTPVIMPKQYKDELQQSMLLFFTGVSRTASDVAKGQVMNMANRRGELMGLKQMADEAAKVVQSHSSPVEEIGKLMHEAWQLKKSLSREVSTPLIDEIYEEGMQGGAWGGKILGAGGGGFILFMAKPGMREQIRSRLSRLIHVDFCFENTGSKVIFCDL